MKAWKIITPIAILLAVGAYSGVSNYNRFVDLEVGVNTAWAQVQTQYQRRNDLIPSLVSTIQGSADFEKSTLTDVVAARASATQVRLDASQLTPETLKQFQQTQAGLSSALSRLLVSVEKYPELKTTQAFTNLQVQLEGTENRIAFARDEFNKVAANYNAIVSKFPANIFSTLFGKGPKPLFVADSAVAPAIQFNFNSKAPAPAQPAPQPAPTQNLPN